MEIKNENIFIDLVKYLSLNNSIFYDSNFLLLSTNKNKDKAFNILLDMELFEKKFKTDKKEIAQILYFNRKSINKILYDKEEKIKLNSEGIQNLSYYFYVSLLINDDPNVINYSYSIEYIKKLNNIAKNNNNNYIYSKIIISKVILELINNYDEEESEDIEDNNKKEKEEIEQIENYNKKVIEENINIFKKLNLDSKLKKIESILIDEIYVKILKDLIIENKIKDYEYTYNIIRQLNLESIKITENIFNQMKKILDKNNNYINQYLISKEEDLYNNMKINFYFILLKYILKDFIFIYQLEILLETRKLIINLIKSNKNFILSLNEKILDDSLRERLDIVIEKIIDLEYYIQKYKNLTKKDLKNNDKPDINNKLDIIGFDSEKPKENNQPNISNNQKESEKIDEKNEQDNQKESNNDNDIIVAKEVSSSDDEVNNSIINYNSDNESSESNNKNSIIKQAIPNDSSINNSSSSIISNSNKILIPKNSNTKQIQLNSYSSNIIKAKVISSQEYNLDHSFFHKSKKKLYNKADIINYRFFYLYKIIGHHKTDKVNKNKNNYTAEFFLEIKDGFISGGTNDVLYIYNKSYKKVMKIKEVDNIINHVFQKISENEILTIIPNKNIIFFYIIDIEEKRLTQIYKKSNKDIGINIPLEFLFILKESNNNFYLCCKNSIQYYPDVLIPIRKPITKTIAIDSVKSGVKIYNNFIAFKSCKIVNSILKFYNSLKGMIYEKEIKNYSLNYSTNGLLLIPKEEIETDNRILLCACKKYMKYQKNGILLLNLKRKYNNLKIVKYFYDTKNFEVYCFCPILLYKNDKIFDNNIEDTEYFLVGGFELNKKKGIIKLFKIIYNDNNDNKIEYLQDITFEQNIKNSFQYFKGPISSIVQSKEDGRIIITCWDGNIYLFSFPNIEYLLKYDKQFKNNISFKEFFIK